MYKIDALDTFTFRTANPFDAGVNFHSESKFPPSPAVYAGAFRGDKSLEQRKIKIGFNGLMFDNQYVFPKPLDLVQSDNQLEMMVLEKAACSSHQLDYMLQPKKDATQKKSTSSDAYLEKNALEKYLSGNSGLPYLLLDDYITSESHIGIAMDENTHSTINGMWYDQESIRPIRGKRTCSLIAEGEGFQLDNNTIVKVGGNRKLATVTTIEPFTIEANLQTRLFKLYFATPAIFKYGWLPRWINPVTKEGVFSYKRKKVKVRLVAAAVGKPIPIGGYSSKGSRPLHLAIPAGSVYYFELLEGTLEAAATLFHQKCISDYRAGIGLNYEWWNRFTYCDRGFGFVFAGNVEGESNNGN